MTKHSAEERLDRLEYCFLMFAAMVTGTAHEATETPEEFTETQVLLGVRMQEMRDELLG